MSRRLRQRFLILTVSILLTISLLHCGAARRKTGAADQPARHRYDERLTLQLDEIIFGLVGSVELREPVSLAPIAGGEIVILDRGTGRLILLDADRTVVREAGISSLADARPVRPRWVRAGIGLAYSVATEQGRLLTYDSQLRFVTALEPSVEVSGYSGGNLSGLAITSFGDTYMTDRDNEVVYHFDPSGRFLETIGGPDAGLGRLNRPHGLAVADDGRVIVCDTGARRVVVFDQYGQFLTSLGEGELQGPVAVALTPDEHAVFVCDGKEPQLVRYTLDGKQLSQWDGLDFVPDGFGELADVVVADSSLWVVDSGRRRVMRFRILLGDQGGS